jgi:hypothetical protein
VVDVRAERPGAVDERLAKCRPIISKGVNRKLSLSRWLRHAVSRELCGQEAVSDLGQPLGHAFSGQTVPSGELFDVGDDDIELRSTENLAFPGRSEMSAAVVENQG